MNILRIIMMIAIIVMKGEGKLKIGGKLIINVHLS